MIEQLNMGKNHPHLDQAECLHKDQGQIHQMNQLAGK